MPLLLRRWAPTSARTSCVAAGASGFALASLIARAAVASEGVLEINQTCAIQTGCFAGDAAGLPVTITASGSYQLTSNLAIPNENTDGIQIDADDVSLDLNGLAIRGPVTCSIPPAVCVPDTGTGRGVFVNVSTRRGTSVKNGAISGMGLNGIVLGEQAEVLGVRVRWNDGNGIGAGPGSTIDRNVVQQNGSIGILIGLSGVVSGNAVLENRLAGISAGSNALISGNSATGNGASGIGSGIGARISDNAVRDNIGSGITATSGAAISGNSVYSNGGNGISAGLGSLIHGNAIFQNTGFGIAVPGAGSGYRENVIQNNTGGTVSGVGVNLGNNLCDGAIACP